MSEERRSMLPFGMDELGKKYSEKDDTYRKMLLDYYCLVAQEFNLDSQRMRENYLLKNNRLNKSEYRHLCSTFDDNHERTDMFIDAYNFTGNIIESLKGEELNRPFPFSVVANSDRINNRAERLKQEAINGLIEKIFQIEIDKVNAIYQAKMQSVNKQEMEQKKAEIEETYARIYKNLPDIKDVIKKYENISSLEEITMNKVMKMLYHKNQIKMIKNYCFEDLLLTAGEFVEIYNHHPNSLPKIKRLNTLYTFYQKSPDVQFIDEGDFAGYRERITVDQAVQELGEYMDDDDYVEIISMGANWGVLGYEQHFGSKGDPDPWRAQRFGTHGSGYAGGMSGMDEWIDVGMEEFGSPFSGFIPNKVGDFVGLHTTLQRRNMNRYIEKYTVYWKGKRKIGRLTYYNDYNELETTIVDEEFPVPKDAVKEVYKRDNLAKSVTEWVWEDKNGNRMSIEWMSINEVWKGIRLGRKHIVVEPLMNSYQSLMNPFEVRLPICGIIINNANALSLSKMDAMKPWQKLYFSMMAKVLKMIYLDRGSWTFINTMFMDAKENGISKAMAIAEDQGYVLYNPSLSAKDGLNPLMQNSKIADNVNMTNFQAIQGYLQMLEFVEQNIIKASGMSAQRIAMPSQNSTATDNYRETQGSMNITEPLFYIHDVFWERVMKSYMEMVLITLSNNSGILRDFLNDEEKTVVDLDYVSLVDNFNLRVGNSGKQVRVLEAAQQWVQALIQNDKINTSQFISLMKSEDLTEFQHQLKEIEEKNREREEAMQQQQMEHEKEMEAKQIKLMEDAQTNELHKEYLRGYMAYHKDRMKAIYQGQAFDAEKDYNKDGIADIMQLEQLMRKLDIEEKKVDAKLIEIDQKSKQKERELDIKQIGEENKIASKAIDSNDSEKDRQNKENIAKMQAAMKKKAN